VAYRCASRNAGHLDTVRFSLDVRSIVSEYLPSSLRELRPPPRFLSRDQERGLRALVAILNWAIQRVLYV
jgi:hypothetical protein